MLQIYNTLTKNKEIFKPIIPGKIKMYVCGITPYDYSHIGHARSFIVFDVITRYLRVRGYDVTLVRNITDIDDKIIKRAIEGNEDFTKVTERFIQAWNEDTKALDILAPDYEPCATQYIAEIIQLTQKLLANGYAYIAGNGDVCYSVNKFKDYGKLSNRNLEELIAGTRVEIAESKQNPLDFVLWKLAKPGEPKWNSPWGEGRPGWHIECSAMSSNILGQPFDIHGGGMDLKFPHHENEIAQSEAALEKKYANYWMHVGLLEVDNVKMSKSLGNFFTIRDVLAKYPAEELRYFMLSGHYRSPLNYSEDNLAQVHQSLTTLYTALRDLPDAAENNTERFHESFNAAMDDDFNTPVAFATLFEMAREINRLRKQNKIEEAAGLAAGLREFGKILGFLQQDPNHYLQGRHAENDIDNIENLIAARKTAREQKNWQEADRIREQLSTMGIIIEDNSTGTHWRRE